MKIRILVTGGTFDKEYDELTGRLFFRDTHLPEMLRPRAVAGSTSTIETVMMIDSLDLDDDGRARIVERARRVRRAGDRHHARHRHDGARRRGRSPRPTSRDKTIVLTGAMVPYAFGSSDGLFNLGQRAVVRAGAAARRLRRDERAALPVGRGAQEPRDGIFEARHDPPR